MSLPQVQFLTWRIKLPDYCEKKEKLVGPARFELATSCTPSKRASQAAPRPDQSWRELQFTTSAPSKGVAGGAISYRLRQFELPPASKNCAPVPRQSPRAPARAAGR